MKEVISLLQKNIPLIAVSFTDSVENGTIESAKNAGLDIAELRVDLFEQYSPDHISQ